MKPGVLMLATCVMLSFVSCNKERISGNGNTITETRNLSGFTAITATGSSNVYISKGNSFNVLVKGFSNLLSHYETKLVNGTLQLGFPKDVNVRHNNIEVYVTLPELTGIRTEGSGDINATGDFTGNTQFDAVMEGSGNINIQSGSTQNFYSVIEGSGNIRAIDMRAEKAETNITGSGNTEISASSTLKVKITGSGNVYYRGTPVITTNITGSGAVIPR